MRWSVEIQLVLMAGKDWVTKALELDPKYGPVRATYRELQQKFRDHNAQQRKQMAAAFAPAPA